MEKKNNIFAILSLSLALGNIAIYILLYSVGLNLGIVSIINAVVCITAGVFGIVARNQINKDQTQKGKGMAIAGMIIGFLIGAYFLLIAFTVMNFGNPEITKKLCEEERLTTSCERTEQSTTKCLYGYNTEITCYTDILKDGQYK
jgi:hypothetical protein